jgi:hypothetical protein
MLGEPRPTIEHPDETDHELPLRTHRKSAHVASVSAGALSIGGLNMCSRAGETLARGSLPAATIEAASGRGGSPPDPDGRESSPAMP